MAYDIEMGDAGLRKEVIDATLKIFAGRKYIFKDLLTISSNVGWSNTYWREDPSVLTAGNTSSIAGLPRGATFPHANPKFEEITAYVQKYGLETTIFWEDIISGKIDVTARSLLKLIEAVVSNVDGGIRNTIVADGNIQSITIEAGCEWDMTASAAIIDNLEEAEEKIGRENYDTSNLMVIVNHRDKRSIINYLVQHGNKLASITDEKLRNKSGVIGTLGNKTFMVSPNVQASEAFVVVPKACGTWRQLYPLSSAIKEMDPFVSQTIKVVEVGQVEITDPKAIVWIKNTKS